MKKMIALVLVSICVIALVGCAKQQKEQPLVSLMPTQKMIEDIAAGNLDVELNIESNQIFLF